MSESGGALPPTSTLPTSTPPTSTLAAEPSSEIPLWLVIGLVLVMIVGVAFVGVALLTGKHDKDEAPTYPSAWDPRIAPYAKVVEKQRGLTFLHPVAVRFLPDAAFEKTVRTDRSKLDEEDRKEIEQATGMMRALGFIGGDVDLLDASDDAHGSGTLAYYSFDDRRITIRGLELKPSVRATLVHELTHALQDQRFGVGARLTKLDKESKHASTSEGSVLRAITEGDAERVSTLYRNSLTPKQRKALDKGRRDETDTAGQKLQHVPKVVLTMISAPYTLGQALVEAVAQNGGNAAVDELFRDTPTHETALLDPFEVVLGGADAVKVPVPAVGDGEKKFASGELGVLTWYFMLSEHMPAQDALAAADGWGGDAYVVYDHAGTSCVRAAYAGRTAADTARMESALRRWITALPGSSATATVDGDLVRFASCDPGHAAKGGTDGSVEAMNLAAVRTYLGLAIVRAGNPARLGRCVAGKLVTQYPVANLADPRFGVDDPTVKARVQQDAAACR